MIGGKKTVNKVVIKDADSGGVRVWLDGREIAPDRSLKVQNHSPDGFNVGYGGSGPAQLALALLLEVADEETARKYYQKYKWEQVAYWSSNTDYVTDIEGWLRAVQFAERTAEKAVSDFRNKHDR